MFILFSTHCQSHPEWSQAPRNSWKLILSMDKKISCCGGPSDSIWSFHVTLAPADPSGMSGAGP